MLISFILEEIRELIYPYTKRAKIWNKIQEINKSQDSSGWRIDCYNIKYADVGSITVKPSARIYELNDKLDCIRFEIRDLNDIEEVIKFVKEQIEYENRS